MPKKKSAKKPKKKKSASPRKLGELRQMVERQKTQGLSELQRGLLFTGEKVDAFCRKNRWAPATRKKFLQLTSFEIHDRLKAVQWAEKKVKSKRTKPETRQKYLELLEMIMKHEKSQVKAELAYLLAQYEIKSADEVLKRWFTFASRSTANDAAQKIAKLKHRRFLPFLLSELKKHQGGPFEPPAAWALGVMGFKEAVPELLKALKRKEEGFDTSFRQEVIQALGRIPDERSLLPLTKACASYKRSETSFMAARSLRRIVQALRPIENKKFALELQKTYCRLLLRRVKRARMDPQGSLDLLDSNPSAELRESLYPVLGLRPKDLKTVEHLLAPLDRLKKVLIAESIFFRSDFRRNIPKSKDDRRRISFWISLRNDAKERDIGEVVKIIAAKKL